MQQQLSADSIDSLIKKYLRSCSSNQDISKNEIKRLESCKSIKTQNIDSGNNKYEFSSFDPEFKELLQYGWKNDEEFNEMITDIMVFLMQKKKYLFSNIIFQKKFIYIYKIYKWEVGGQNLIKKMKTINY